MMGVLTLTLRGDLLARSDFFPLAEFAHQHRFLLRVATVGHPITAANADRLAELHPLAVEVQLFGPNAAAHDALTGIPGSYGATLEALRLLRARTVRTILRSQFQTASTRQLSALRALAADLGAQLCCDQKPQRATSDGALGGYRLTCQELDWLKRETAEPEFWLTPAAVKGTTCILGQNAVTVDPYGNVFPCAEVHLCAGNVRLQTLTQIWNDRVRWTLIQEYVRSEAPACSQCKLAVYERPVDYPTAHAKAARGRNPRS